MLSGAALLRQAAARVQWRVGSAVATSSVHAELTGRQLLPIALEKMICRWLAHTLSTPLTALGTVAQAQGDALTPAPLTLLPSRTLRCELDLVAAPRSEALPCLPGSCTIRKLPGSWMA
jgi:hypothetical protein